MNIQQTSAYLSLSDAELVVLNLQGLANNREVAQAFVSGAVIEESGDGISFNITADPAWDLEVVYQVKVEYKNTVATAFVAPIKDAPLVGTNYYSPCLTDARKYLIYSWVGSEGDLMRLSRGLVHVTIDSAILHANALLNVE